MKTFNVISRRSFLDRTFKTSLAVALATLTDIPLVMKRALAEGNIGLNGKKLLFIFLRGANDALNSVIPIQDSAYNGDINPSTGQVIRPNIFIPKDGLTDYTASGPCDFPQSSATSGDPNYNTFFYNSALRAGNGFAALHPSLKFLAPVYNAGDLALLHRVGYPRQSRSHFDSQNYWENGNPNNNLSKDGIFYRTILESGLAATNPLTGVSIQSALPLLFRGSEAAMTNLSDPLRYNLFGIPNNTAGNLKMDRAINTANPYPFADKRNRDFMQLQYENMVNTLPFFDPLVFDEGNGTTTGNYFRDDANTDGDTVPYYLFPTSNAKNGGYAAHANDNNKYVVDTGAYGFIRNLKAASLVLNSTDAIIAGTELGGFDTHSAQGGATGSHANLQRRIAWAMYALKKFFTRYGRGGPDAMLGAKANWDDVVVITLSEFGRTTIQNTDSGTDHAEAGVMFVAGGAVKGYNAGNPTGVFGCHPGDSVPWITGLANQGGGVDGSMFGVSDRYLKRAIDFRSVLGRIIRDHLGATQGQLNRIIPGYAVTGERLLSGGVSSVDNTTIMGEVGIL